MRSIFKVLTVAGLFVIFSCQGAKNNNQKDQSNEAIDTSVFYANHDNKDVLLYVIKNDKLEVSLTNFGARLVSVVVNDKSNKPVDVILGYDKAEDYIANTNNFYGAVVGRYGNRIGNGTFKLGDNTYQLEINNGKNTLHGGKNGVFNKVWDVKSISDDAITLEYLSPDGEAGFPGNVKMSVTYKLNNDGGLEIHYEGETDKETVLNLTNHAYFNLNGAGDSTILDHELWIDADKLTEVNKGLIPTGINSDVKGTPFDFTVAKSIGKDIDQKNQQLTFGKGYDHNFVLNKKEGFTDVATLYAPKTGIEMKVITTEPGLQFYSGNFMSSDEPRGKGGKSYPYRSALCLETQHFPDSPNQPSFPSTVLSPGQKYSTKTEYRFSVR
ncbi:MAG: aldose epimerase family protein [Sphingobacterium composti]